MSLAVEAPPAKTRVLRILDARNDAEALFELRRATYMKAPEFRVVDIDALRWNEHDESGLVLGIYDDQALIATMRASVFASRAAAERLFEYSLDHAAIDYPASGISRVATDPARAGSGLNALLRRIVIERSQALGLQSVVGVVYEGAPRTRAMANMGYAMWRSEDTWDRETEAIAHPMIASLPRERFNGALKFLEAQGKPSVECAEAVFAQVDKRFLAMFACANQRSPLIV